MWQFRDWFRNVAMKGLVKNVAMKGLVKECGNVGIDKARLK